MVREHIHIVLRICIIRDFGLMGKEMAEARNNLIMEATLKAISKMI